MSTLITLFTVQLLLPFSGGASLSSCHFQGITILGVAASLCWVALERLLFVKRRGQHGGQLWLEDVMSDMMKPITSISIAAPIQLSAHHVYSSVRSIPSYIRQYSAGASSSSGVSTEPPTTQEVISMSSFNTEAKSDDTDEDRRTRARERFRGAVRAVMLLQSHSTRSLRSPSLEWLLPSPASRAPSIIGRVARPSSISVISQRLRTLECSEDISPHQALVRDMQFSPDGKYLATARWLQSLNHHKSSLFTWPLSIAGIRQHVFSRSQ